MVPTTIPGQLITGGLMLFGALTMSLPVLAIVAKFQLYYEKNLEQVGDISEEELSKMVIEGGQGSDKHPDTLPLSGSNDVEWG